MNPALHSATDLRTLPDANPGRPAPDAPNPEAGSAGTSTPRPTEGTGAIAGPFFLWLPLALLVAGVLLQAVDTLLAKAAFDVIVNQNETISALIAFALAGIGAVAAIETGIAIQSRHRIAAGFLGGLWALIGASMAWLRYNTETIAGADENSVGDGAIAILMLVLYLAAGAGIIYSMQKIWNPKYRVLWSSRFGRWRVDRVLTKLEPRYARVHLTLEQLDGRRDTLGAELATGQVAVRTHAEELKARARLKIAELLGDTAKTSLYRQPTWPEQADRAAGDGDAPA